MGTRSPLDRSAAHEALLYTCDEFAKADMFRGGEIITEFLEAFYASPSLNMYDFAKSWAQEREEHAPRPSEPRGDQAQREPAFRVEPGQQVRFIEQPEVRFEHELPPPPPSPGVRAEVHDGLMRVRRTRKAR